MGLEVPTRPPRPPWLVLPWENDVRAALRHARSEDGAFGGDLLGRGDAPEPPQAQERTPAERGVLDRFLEWLANALHLW